LRGQPGSPLTCEAVVIEARPCILVLVRVDRDDMTTLPGAGRDLELDTVL
jgi:hypothetical protein